MAQAYSAGLTVTENIVLKKDRILPLKGKVLVKKGDRVKADDLIAETFLPGKVVPFKLANKLGVTPQMLSQFVKVKPGDHIKKDQILAETKGLFGTGLFKVVVKSPIDGEVDSISSSTGNAVLREPKIPVQIKAFIDGIITEVIEDEGVVIENRVAYIQGIFGLAGETTGVIKVLSKGPTENLDPSMITADCKGKIIVAGTLCPLAAIEKAKEVGVAAIIAGGIDDQDLKKLLGYDIGVAITGHEKIGVTIVATEGFGPIHMAQNTFDLLKKFEGKKASIHGKTQIRAGVMRPEIIIPLALGDEKLVAKEAEMATLEINSLIRVIRQPNFGKIGRITALPEPLTKVESETMVRVLKAKLDTGEEVLIPRANVEVIAED
ncbi:MAG: hypothetical protein B6226_01535 [Candidatus Cloacimonetes bacterium 4572_65]|nr:MAG: hypothetical protein B6226_01535 [Candidatus Cloacimonetes bacterium 4572_65]